MKWRRRRRAGALVGEHRGHDGEHHALMAAPTEKGEHREAGPAVKERGRETPADAIEHQAAEQSASRAHHVSEHKSGAASCEVQP